MIISPDIRPVEQASRPARPFIVGIGGTTREGSSTESALLLALRSAADMGARTAFFGAKSLDLPLYQPNRSFRTAEAEMLVSMVRQADGLIIASPGYHGGISGLVKNALDYIEDLREDDRPYLDGRAVGCVATAAGWQGTITTLSALRDVVHALRGWPTPLGVGINNTEKIFDAEGVCVSPQARKNIELMTAQVVGFSAVPAMKAVEG